MVGQPRQQQVVWLLYVSSSRLAGRARFLASTNTNSSPGATHAAPTTTNPKRFPRQCRVRVRVRVCVWLLLLLLLLHQVTLTRANQIFLSGSRASAALTNTHAGAQRPAAKVFNALRLPSGSELVAHEIVWNLVAGGDQQLQTRAGEREFSFSFEFKLIASDQEARSSGSPSKQIARRCFPHHSHPLPLCVGPSALAYARTGQDTHLAHISSCAHPQGPPF